MKIAHLVHFWNWCNFCTGAIFTLLRRARHFARVEMGWGYIIFWL